MANIVSGWGRQGLIRPVRWVRCTGWGRALGPGEANLALLVVELKGKAMVHPALTAHEVLELGAGWGGDGVASGRGVGWDSAAREGSPRARLAATRACAEPWGALELGPPRLSW